MYNMTTTATIRLQNGANVDLRSREAGMTALHLAVTRAATVPGALGKIVQDNYEEEDNNRNDNSKLAHLSDSLRHGCAHLLLAAGAATELEDHRKLCEHTLVPKPNEQMFLRDRSSDWQRSMCGDNTLFVL